MEKSGDRQVAGPEKSPQQSSTNHISNGAWPPPEPSSVRGKMRELLSAGKCVEGIALVSGSPCNRTPNEATSVIKDAPDMVQAGAASGK